MLFVQKKSRSILGHAKSAATSNLTVVQLPCGHTLPIFTSISDNQQMQTRLDMSCLMLKKPWYARGYSCSSLTWVSNGQYHDGQHLAMRVLHQSSGSPIHLWNPTHDGGKVFTVWRSLSKAQLGLDDTTSKTGHASGDMLKMTSESTIAACGYSEDNCNSMIWVSCPTDTRQTLTANGRPQRGRMLSPRAYFWSIAMASAITFKERYIKTWTCRCNLSAECMTTDCMDWARPCLLPSITV